MKPGETANDSGNLLAFIVPGKGPGKGLARGVRHWIEAKPGEHTIRFKQKFPVRFVDDPRQWAGELESGTVAVKIAPNQE